MLAFFRKYQKYFYTLITVIIVISFSFFGTYGAISEDSYQDAVVFTAVDGSSVTRSELERMALFLSTDSEDMKRFGGMWGPNFFNDGVIEKDFLNTGIVQVLVAQYGDELRPDLEGRLAREKRFQPYVHPYNSAISAEEIWSRYNPEMTDHLKVLRGAADPISEDSFDARIHLYLAERMFSGNDLKQSLMYIEQMNSQYMRPDPNLPYSDLSLFGYRTVDDWFGPRFVRLVSEFIINSAKIAQAKGYDVPKEEVLADLIRNAKISFAQNRHHTRLGVTNPTQYFQEQLRRMHMDQTQAINTWRQVMLFRRMFHDIGNAVVTDPFTYREFHEFAKDSVTGEVYALPAALQLSSFRDLQQFQVYLKSVAPKTKDRLALPDHYLPMDEIPTELIERNYLVEIGEVNKLQLQTRVGVRQMWDWQVQDTGWSQLTEQFPELSNSDASAPDERRLAIDKLDNITRTRLDSFSRKQIVEKHPEWVAEALQKGAKQRRTLSIREKGGTNPLPGVEDRIEFMKFLNEENNDQPRLYTPDDKTYYHITVIEKAKEPQVLTYGEAKQEGVLLELANQRLEKYYQRIRDASPEEFQTPDGEWKEFHYVRDQVAERYFSKILQAIADETEVTTPDAAATQRFLPYVRQVRKRIKKEPAVRAEFVRDEEASALQEWTQKKHPLSDQWKLTVKPFTLDRSSEDSKLLQVKPNSWTQPEALPNGAIAFRHIKARETTTNDSAITRGVQNLHKLLSNSSQQVFTHTVLKEINGKNAISLNYLNPKN